MIETIRKALQKCKQPILRDCKDVENLFGFKFSDQLCDGEERLVLIEFVPDDDHAFIPSMVFYGDTREVPSQTKQRLKKWIKLLDKLVKSCYDYDDVFGSLNRIAGSEFNCE